MHDPQTVAFEIKWPWPARQTQWAKTFKDRWLHRPTIVTIWHVDPERDGTDDSCGWFKRARHGDAAIRTKIRKEFAHRWDADYGGWFDKDGTPLLSPSAIVLDMFYCAARRMLEGWGDRHGWRRGDRFVRRHLFDILHFAENTTDSWHSFITQKYGPSPREDRIDEAVSVVYGCLLRWTQPWYRHARWHVWHWKFQVHLTQTFKRWAFSRCEGCGGRFRWGYAPTSFQWDSDGPTWFRGERGVYHRECSNQISRSDLKAVAH